MERRRDVNEPVREPSSRPRPVRTGIVRSGLARHRRSRSGRNHHPIGKNTRSIRRETTLCRFSLPGISHRCGFSGPVSPVSLRFRREGGNTSGRQPRRTPRRPHALCHFLSASERDRNADRNTDALSIRYAAHHLRAVRHADSSHLPLPAHLRSSREQCHRRRRLPYRPGNTVSMEHSPRLSPSAPGVPEGRKEAPMTRMIRLPHDEQ